jgi:phosphoribosyl-ATP pyrophosphohydrolase
MTDTSVEALRFRATVRHDGAEVEDLPYLEEFWAVRASNYAALLAERDRYKARVERAEEALAYYADKTNWIETSAANDDPHDGRLRDVWNGGLEDGWGAAQSVLTQIDAEPAEPRQPAVHELFDDAWKEAQKAMRKFPQPNYVISKVAEEAGEVVKAAIHCAEGRDTPEHVTEEITQAIAMLLRLYVEGDQVHGLRALAEGDNQ